MARHAAVGGDEEDRDVGDEDADGGDEEDGDIIAEETVGGYEEMEGEACIRPMLRDLL